jgi:hypothetical protein
VSKNGKQTSQMIILVSIHFSIYIIYLFTLLTIYLTPSIPDESTAAPHIDKLLIPKDEWLKCFPNATVKDVIREILNYISMNIPPKKGNFKNINLFMY